MKGEKLVEKTFKKKLEGHYFHYNMSLTVYYSAPAQFHIEKNLQHSRNNNLFKC